MYKITLAVKLINLKSLDSLIYRITYSLGGSPFKKPIMHTLITTQVPEINLIIHSAYSSTLMHTLTLSHI